MSLNKEIEKMFNETPNLSEKEAVNQLKKMKDPDTDKKLWKATTIRNKVRLFLLRRGKKDSAKPVGKTVQVSSSESKEKETKHDPFKTDESVDKPSKEIDIVLMKKDIDNQIMDLKTDVVDIVKDFKSEVVYVVDGLKQDMKTFRKDIVSYTPVVEYDDLKLDATLIDRIQDNMSDTDFGDESDYLKDLLNNHDKYKESHDKYDKIENIVRSSKNGIHIVFENGKIAFEEIKKGRLGLNLRSVLIGAVVGGAVASLVTYLLCAFFFVAETTGV